MKGQGSFSFNQMVLIIIALVALVIIYGLYVYFSGQGHSAVQDIIFGALE